MTKAVYTGFVLVTLHHPIMLVNNHMSDEIYAPYICNSYVIYPIIYYGVDLNLKHITVAFTRIK